MFPNVLDLSKKSRREVINEANCVGQAAYSDISDAESTEDERETAPANSASVDNRAQTNIEEYHPRSNFPTICNQFTNVQAIRHNLPIFAPPVREKYNTQIRSNTDYVDQSTVENDIIDTADKIQTETVFSVTAEEYEIIQYIKRNGITRNALEMFVTQTDINNNSDIRTERHEKQGTPVIVEEHETNEVFMKILKQSRTNKAVFAKELSKPNITLPKLLEAINKTTISVADSCTPREKERQKASFKKFKIAFEEFLCNFPDHDDDDHGRNKSVNTVENQSVSIETSNNTESVAGKKVAPAANDSDVCSIDGQSAYANSMAQEAPRQSDDSPDCQMFLQDTILTNQELQIRQPELLVNDLPGPLPVEGQISRQDPSAPHGQHTQQKLSPLGQTAHQAQYQRGQHLPQRLSGIVEGQPYLPSQIQMPSELQLPPAEQQPPSTNRSQQTYAEKFQKALQAQQVPKPAAASTDKKKRGRKPRAQPETPRDIGLANIEMHQMPHQPAVDPNGVPLYHPGQGYRQNPYFNNYRMHPYQKNGEQLNPSTQHMWSNSGLLNKQPGQHMGPTEPLTQLMRSDTSLNKQTGQIMGPTELPRQHMRYNTDLNNQPAQHMGPTEPLTQLMRSDTSLNKQTGQIMGPTELPRQHMRYNTDLNNQPAQHMGQIQPPMLHMWSNSQHMNTIEPRTPYMLSNNQRVSPIETQTQIMQSNNQHMDPTASQTLYMRSNSQHMPPIKPPTQNMQQGQIERPPQHLTDQQVREMQRQRTWEATLPIYPNSAWSRSMMEGGST